MDKKHLNILFICLISLFLFSAVSAADESHALSSKNYQITSDSSNDDIQLVLDSADEGDTLEFTDVRYDNISLVVDKKVNIVSEVNSKVYASNQTSAKAESLKIADTFGFYFTSNAAGSTLSGITLIASHCDYGIVLDSCDNVFINGNSIVGPENAVLVKNADGVTMTCNNISKAKSNGIQLKNVSNSEISKNELSYNGRSGLETSNICRCNITNNTIHHNAFNGISMYNASSRNLIEYNEAFENPNGIYIDSQSSYDVINANSFIYNRKDTDYELGAFESGNGLLFGADFKTSKEGSPSRLEVRYNVLAHNEGYQAKNNPELPTFKLGDNWFDSTDDANTFVCPMLLAGIMKMGTVSVKNGIGLQMYDTEGEAVRQFATFDTKVNIDGNQYTARFVNGKATIDANLDEDREYDIEVMIGGQPVKYKYRTAAGQKDDNQDSKTSYATDGNRGASGDGSEFSQEFSNGGVAKGMGEQKNSTSASAHYSYNRNSGVYGTNASGNFKDSSDNGQDVTTDGDASAGDAGEGEVTLEGKAYEIIPPSKISKEVSDTSGLVVLSIVSLLGCLVYGYRNKSEFD